MPLQARDGISRFTGIAGGYDECEGCELGSCVDEFVDQALANGETETAVERKGSIDGTEIGVKVFVPVGAGHKYTCTLTIVVRM